MTITPLPKFNNRVSNINSEVVSTPELPREFINGSAVDGTIKPFKKDEVLIEVKKVNGKLDFTGGVTPFIIPFSLKFNSFPLNLVSSVKGKTFTNSNSEKRIHNFKILNVWFSAFCYEVLSVIPYDTYFILSYKRESNSDKELIYIYKIDDKWYENTFSRDNPFKFGKLSTAPLSKLFTKEKDKYKVDGLSIITRRTPPRILSQIRNFEELSKKVKIANFSKVHDILKKTVEDKTNLISVADNGVYSVEGIRSFYGSFTPLNDYASMSITNNLKTNEISKVIKEYSLEKQAPLVSPISFFVGITNKYTGATTKLQEINVHSNQNIVYPLALSTIKITLKYNRDTLSNLELTKANYPRIPERVLKFISSTAKFFTYLTTTTTTVTKKYREGSEINRVVKNTTTKVETMISKKKGASTISVKKYSTEKSIDLNFYSTDVPTNTVTKTVAVKESNFYLTSLTYSVSQEDYLVSLDVDLNNSTENPLVKYSSEEGEKSKDNFVAGLPLTQTLIKQVLFDEDNKSFGKDDFFRDFSTKPKEIQLLLGGEKEGTGFASPDIGSNIASDSTTSNV